MTRVVYLILLGLSMFFAGLLLDVMPNAPLMAKAGLCLVFGGFGIIALWGIIKNGDIE